MRLKPFLVVFALSLIAIASGMWYGADWSTPAQATNYQPFTATVVEMQHEGEKFDTTQILYARKADGSSARIVYLEDPNGQPKQYKEIIDAPNSSYVVVDGLTRSTTTYNDEWNWISDSCTNEELGGVDGGTVRGYRTIKLLDLITLPGGPTIKIESYEAPALGCFVLLQKQYASMNAAPFELFQSREVTSITTGEPNGTLFVLPKSGYVERKPTDVFREFGHLYPHRKKSEAGLLNLRNQDESYALSGVVK